MIDCLVAAYRDNPDCSIAEQAARLTCAVPIMNYQGCALTQPDPPAPAPAPAPVPTPAPKPPIPGGCSGTGSGNAFSCSLTMKCGDRSYDDIHCKQNADGTSSCACGSTFVILNESVETACASGISNCAR
jgi:hypothetical protein